MPIAASFTDVFRDLTKFLGVNDPNYPEGGEVRPNSPYTKLFLQKKLVQADVEVVLLICSIEDHPFRNQFFTTEPTAINANARIPAYLGVHGGVKIQTNPAASEEEEENWVDGDLAQSYDHLKTARRKAKLNKDRFGERRSLYWIENGKIELIRPDLKAKVYVPTIPTQVEEYQLFTPFPYATAPLAKCLSQLRMANTDVQHRNDWKTIWMECEAAIYGKALNLPEPERLQRLAT